MQFLTSIPTGSTDSLRNARKHEMLMWFPAVGIGIGSALMLCGWALQSLPPFLQASLLVVMWILITGGLHLDGLADCADAWVGGLGSRSRTLEIMKDPRSGTFAVIAIVLAVIVKIAALTAFQDWTVLLIAPFAARLAILPAFLWLPYARETGLGKDLQQSLGKSERKVAVIIILAGLIVPLAIVSFWLWIVLLSAVAVIFFAWRIAMTRRLQGFTGDCIGVLVELVEVSVLLAAVMFEYSS